MAGAWSGLSPPSGPKRTILPGLSTCWWLLSGGVKQITLKTSLDQSVPLFSLLVRGTQQGVIEREIDQVGTLSLFPPGRRDSPGLLPSVGADGAAPAGTALSWSLYSGRGKVADPWDFAGQARVSFYPPGGQRAAENVWAGNWPGWGFPFHRGRRDPPGPLPFIGASVPILTGTCPALLTVLRRG